MVFISVLGLLRRVSKFNMCADSFNYLTVLFCAYYHYFILQGMMTTLFSPCFSSDYSLLMLLHLDFVSLLQLHWMDTCCLSLCSRKCLVHGEIFLKVWTASENIESGMRTNYPYGWFNIPTRLQSTKDTWKRPEGTLTERLWLLQPRL